MVLPIPFILYSFYLCQSQTSVSNQLIIYNFAAIKQPYSVLYSYTVFSNDEKFQTYNFHTCSLNNTFSQIIKFGYWCRNDQPFMAEIEDLYSGMLNVTKYWLHFTEDLSVLFVCSEGSTGMDCLMRKTEKFVFIKNPNIFANTSIASAFAAKLQMNATNFDPNVLRRYSETCQDNIQTQFSITNIISSAKPNVEPKVIYNTTSVVCFAIVIFLIICILLKTRKRQNLVHPLE